MLNVHRRRAVKKYLNKALEPGRIGRIIRDPGVIPRTIKTFAVNRNLRTVPADELLEDAEASVAALARLAVNPKVALKEWLPLEPSASKDTADLGRLFNERGSDKANGHDYFEVYGSILAGKREQAIRVLEVGLGTNNLAFQSNMDWAANLAPPCEPSVIGHQRPT